MKKILFVMPTLSCGGAERALVEMLNNMDYTKYNVDLMLFRKDDMYYLNKITDKVNILENDILTKLCFDHVKHVIKSPLRLKKINIVVTRIWQTGISKIRKFFRMKKYYYTWKTLRKMVPDLQKEYDVVIGNLEGDAVYYIIDKVNANKKIGWMRTDYIKGGFNPEFDKYYFEKLDCLFSVSEDITEMLKQNFPEIKYKLKTMYNLLDSEKIMERGKEDLKLEEDTINIVSVGNLRYVKGYDISIEACSYLKKDGYNFKWYVLGEGLERRILETLIKKYDVEDCFILCGLETNPYKYLSRCDIYVQASRHEGFSTTIREAKIFNKPIVVTDTPGMSNQIKNNETGKVTKYADAKSLYEGIKELFDDKSLCEKYIENLKNEKSNNLNIEEQMQILYDEF